MLLSKLSGDKASWRWPFQREPVVGIFGLFLVLGWAACIVPVWQLRHRFEDFFFPQDFFLVIVLAHFLCHRGHTVWCGLLRTCAYRMLIGACNPMLTAVYLKPQTTTENKTGKNACRSSTPRAWCLRLSEPRAPSRLPRSYSTGVPVMPGGRPGWVGLLLPWGSNQMCFKGFLEPGCFLPYTVGHVGYSTPLINELRECREYSIDSNPALLRVVRAGCWRSLVPVPGSCSLTSVLYPRHLQPGVPTLIRPDNWSWARVVVCPGNQRGRQQGVSGPTMTSRALALALARPQLQLRYIPRSSTRSRVSDASIWRTRRLREQRREKERA